MLRIAEAREARGWTQEQLAQAIGTTQQTVQRWESGQVDPKITKIEAISKALGITITYLLGVDMPSNATEQSLTSNEYELVRLYRNMSDLQKSLIISVAQNFVTKQRLEVHHEIN